MRAPGGVYVLPSFDTLRTWSAAAHWARHWARHDRAHSPPPAPLAAAARACTRKPLPGRDEPPRDLPQVRRHLHPAGDVPGRHLQVQDRHPGSPPAPPRLPASSSHAWCTPPVPPTPAAPAAPLPPPTQEDYPADYANPEVFFTTDVFHPLVDEATGKLNLKAQFPVWRNNVDYIVFILVFIKKIFYMKKFRWRVLSSPTHPSTLCRAPLPHTAAALPPTPSVKNVVNKLAFDLFNTGGAQRPRFAERAQACVKDSLENCHESEPESSMQFSAFQPAHQARPRAMLPRRHHSAPPGATPLSCLLPTRLPARDAFCPACFLGRRTPRALSPASLSRSISSTRSCKTRGCSSRRRTRRRRQQMRQQQPPRLPQKPTPQMSTQERPRPPPQPPLQPPPQPLPPRSPPVRPSRGGQRRRTRRKLRRRRRRRVRG